MEPPVIEFRNVSKRFGEVAAVVDNNLAVKAGEFLSNYGDMDKPSKFLGKAMATPSLWRMFPEAVKFMIT